MLGRMAHFVANRCHTPTRAALAAYKARGGKLGAARPEVPKLTAEARARGARAAPAAEGGAWRLP